LVVHAHRPAEQAQATKGLERRRSRASVEQFEHLHRDPTRTQMLAQEAGLVVHVVLQDSDRLHVRVATAGIGFWKGPRWYHRARHGCKIDGMPRAFERPLETLQGSSASTRRG